MRRLNHLSRLAGAGAAVLLLSVSAGGAVAKTLDDRDRANAQALAKCAGIENDEARLICFDAVATAIKSGASGREAAGRVPVRRAQDDDSRAAEMERREAELERQRAETERAAAALEAEQAEREKQMRAVEARMREAEARIREAEERLRDAEKDLREAARAEEAARAARVEADAEARASDETPDRRARILGIPLPFAGDLPETTPALFGISDLPEERAAKVSEGLDLEKVFNGEELDSIEARVIGYGHKFRRAWVKIEGGAVWRQTSGKTVRFLGDGPKTVQIERGALGAFLMRLEGRGAAIRVKRIR